MKRGMKILAVAAGCAGFFLGSIGMTNAYLSKPTNNLNNVITPGSIEVNLTEPLWKKESAEDLIPGQVVSKNPTVTNVGKNEAWVFLKVDVPVKNIALVNPETKKKTKRTDTELFSFAVDESWELISRTEEHNSVEYVYGYNEIVEPNKSTTALFREVCLVSYLEGEIDSKEVLKMPIETVAIQGNVESADQGLKKIYQEYLDQEISDEEGGMSNE